MILPSDVKVSKGIYMSAAAVDTYTKKSKVVAAVVKKAFPEFKDILNLPSSVTFRVAPIKASKTNGYYDVDNKLVTIDCRLGWAKALEVMAHELVHAEQYYTGRLKKKFMNGKGWLHYWNGTPGKKGTTYNAYREQPWEQEAWSRQATLAEIVCARLEEKYK